MEVLHHRLETVPLFRQAVLESVDKLDLLSHLRGGSLIEGMRLQVATSPLPRHLNTPAVFLGQLSVISRLRHTCPPARPVPARIYKRDARPSATVLRMETSACRHTPLLPQTCVYTTRRHNTGQGEEVGAEETISPRRPLSHPQKQSQTDGVKLAQLAHTVHSLSKTSSNRNLLKTKQLARFQSRRF